MTIQRVYSASWGVGEKLTSAQQNALDLNTSYAIDKRSGQQDIFASMLVATGAGRVIASVATGPDADTTFHVQDGNSIVRVPTLTAARAYTLGHSGATGGDRVYFYVEGTGATASGYADIKNNVGSGLFRLGAAASANFSSSAEGDSCELIFTPTGWVPLDGSGPGMRHVEFTSSTTWVCPPGVHSSLVLGSGAGGGGGGGGGGDQRSWGYVTGGGGGGGAQLVTQRVPLTPNTSYAITVGTGGVGGAGGVAGAVGAKGTDGTDSSFGSLFTARGAAGGEGGRLYSGASGGVEYAGERHLISRGGSPVRSTATMLPTLTHFLTAPNWSNSAPGAGGDSHVFRLIQGSGLASYAGSPSLQGNEGGGGGVQGTNSQTYGLAGAGGGGGGAGPWGGGGGGGGGGGAGHSIVANGAVGGLGGGAMNGGVTGAAGSAGGTGSLNLGGTGGIGGAAGGANSGAGGGGGGAGGFGSNFDASGNAGGAGSAGRVTVIYYK